MAVAKNRAKITFFSGAKKNYLNNIFFLHISSSYAKILGETNFHAREIPPSGWKVEGGEEKERKKKKKKKVGENNGQLRFVRHHVWRTQARLDQFKKPLDHFFDDFIFLQHLAL